MKVPAEEGIPFNPDDVASLDRDLFLDDKGNIDSRVKPGARIPMYTADGYQITGLVKEVTSEHVIMDFNHPLVGQALHFANGKVVSMRRRMRRLWRRMRICRRQRRLLLRQRRMLRRMQLIAPIHYSSYT